jgi:hypothetical protein
MNIIAKIDSTGLTVLNLSTKHYSDLENILEGLDDDRK